MINQQGLRRPGGAAWLWENPGYCETRWAGKTKGHPGFRRRPFGFGAWPALRSECRSGGRGDREGQRQGTDGENRPVRGAGQPLIQRDADDLVTHVWFPLAAGPADGLFGCNQSPAGMRHDCGRLGAGSGQFRCHLAAPGGASAQAWRAKGGSRGHAGRAWRGRSVLANQARFPDAPQWPRDLRRVAGVGRAPCRVIRWSGRGLSLGPVCGCLG